MGNFDFRFTADKSVGLYNYDINDVYHSRFGAMKEAREKFIEPLCLYNFNSSDITVADVCYGIGYNSKALIEHFLSSNFDTKITIDCFEIDEVLIAISPFVVDGLEKYDTAFILLDNLVSKYPNYINFISEFFKNNVEITRNYCKSKLCHLFQKYITEVNTTEACLDKSACLHNIYYHNISDSMKNVIKPLNFGNFILTPYIGDARKTLSTSNLLYDFIFLDAFTPHLQPTLWTYEFIKLLISKLKPNGKIITYTNAAPVRNTFLQLGLYVGKNIIDGKSSGTIACMNEDMVTIPLNNYERAILNTKSAIPYRDTNLNKGKKEILAEHLWEQKQSVLPTVSQLKRSYNEKI